MTESSKRVWSYGDRVTHPVHGVGHVVCYVDVSGEVYCTFGPAGAHWVDSETLSRAPQDATGSTFVFSDGQVGVEPGETTLESIPVRDVSDAIVGYARGGNGATGSSVPARPRRGGWVSAAQWGVKFGEWYHDEWGGPYTSQRDVEPGAHMLVMRRGRIYTGCPSCTREDPHEATECVVESAERIGAITSELALAKAMFAAEMDVEATRRADLSAIHRTPGPLQYAGKSGEWVFGLVRPDADVAAKIAKTLTIMWSDPAYAKERAKCEETAGRVWKARTVIP